MKRGGSAGWTKEQLLASAETRKRGRFFKCLVCEKEFWRNPYAIKKGNNKFCSRGCYAISQKGKTISAECLRKQREARLRKTSQYTQGKLNRFWRASNETKEWRLAVFKRDNWTCVRCGAKSKKNNPVRIEAHHIKPFAKYHELRFILSNGITLCKKCHDKEPKGRKVYDV